jgi:hypothetical protein
MHDVYKSSIIGLCFAQAGGTTPWMTLILRTMNKHAQLMGWGNHWGVKTIMWCLIKADQLGASTKRCTGTPGLVNQHEPVSCTTTAQWRHHNSRRSKARIQNTVRGNEADGSEAL